MPTAFEGFKSGNTIIPCKDVSAFPRSEQAVLGAKNIQPSNGSATQTSNNVTYTKNANGSVTVNTSAAVSADTDYHLNDPKSRPISEIKNGMIMTAVEHAGDSYDAFNAKFYLCIIYRNSSDGYISQQSCIDGPVTLSIPANAAYYRMSIATFTGAEIDNVPVYPMISFDGGDYVPYAMTNKELTENNLVNFNVNSLHDLDNITRFGIYGISTSPTHAPEGVTWAALLVLPNATSTNPADGANGCIQIIFKDNIYTRKLAGSPAAWTSWTKYTGTILS